MGSGRKTFWVQTGVFVRSRKPAHLPLRWCEPEGGCWWDLQPCEPLRTILMVLLLLLACPRGSRVRDTTSTSLTGFGARHNPCLLLQLFCCIIVMKIVIFESGKEGSDTFLSLVLYVARFQLHAGGQRGAWLWYQSLHTVVWCMCMTSQLLHRKKGPKNGKYGEKAGYCSSSCCYPSLCFTSSCRYFLASFGNSFLKLGDCREAFCIAQAGPGTPRTYTPMYRNSYVYITLTPQKFAHV